MKTRNSFSKLRMMLVICFIFAFIGLFGGISRGNSTLMTIGIVALIIGFLVRVLRFMYRD
jgi:hypothetical protein